MCSLSGAFWLNKQRRQQIKLTRVYRRAALLRRSTSIPFTSTVAPRPVVSFHGSVFSFHLRFVAVQSVQNIICII